jgi:DNA-binding XRE family transcriptional regulator
MSVKTAKKIKLKKNLIDANKIKSDEWHRKIAQNRGESWRKNVLAGRRDAILNPSSIRLIRIKNNIMQSVIARKLNLSESAYGAIERGKQKVKETTAKEIADFFAVPLSKIFKPVGNKKFLAVKRKQDV